MGYAHKVLLIFLYIFTSTTKFLKVNSFKEGKGKKNENYTAYAKWIEKCVVHKIHDVISGEERVHKYKGSYFDKKKVVRCDLRNWDGKWW